MMNTERLLDAGIDYKAGVNRFQGDADLYEVVLKAFLKETILEQAQAAYENDDFSTLYRCVHEIKGSSGNMDMTKLYGASSQMVSLLRSNTRAVQELEICFKKLKDAYEMAYEGIQEAMEG